jgi:FemAB-related protein (PEP-CTERM system-associated)
VAKVRAFRESDRENWDAYVVAHPASHFGQRVAWKALTERFFRVTPHYWLAESDGRIRGVLPLFEKRGHALFSAPGGLLADDEATAAQLIEPARELLKRQALDWIELRDQRVAWPGLETSTEHLTLELALESSTEAQWKAFDAKLRNQVRKGERSAFTTRWGREHVREFHRVLLQNMRDLGTPIRSVEYFAAALELFGADADALVMDLEQRPVGAMFTVAHGARFFDPWASSLRRYLALCPNHVLYWAAIRRAIERGMRRFDFGRSQRTSGTYSFKAQWGAEPVQLYYQYALGRAGKMPTLEDQKGSFSAAVAIWRRLPVPVAGVLGERVRRGFPEVM